MADTVNNKTDNDIKPQGEVFFDEFDQQGEHYFKKYEAEKNPDLLPKAADAYSKSNNPDGVKISWLLRGLYHREIAKKEPDHKKALIELKKAHTLFIKCAGPDAEEVKKVKLEYLKRQLLAAGKKPPKDLFLERAKIYQSLKDEKNYHGDMSLYYLFSMTELEPFDEKIGEYAQLMLEHAKQSGHQELLYKAKVIFHRVKSATAPDPKRSLEELEESLGAIQQTSDHFGEEEAKANILFTRAMITPDKKKRTALLAESAARWNKLGNKKQEIAALKMVLPVPVNVTTILGLTDKTLENHQLLNKKIHELITIKPGPYALFHHHSHLIERIKDFKKIVGRLGQNRKEITDLTIKENSTMPKNIAPGKPYPKRIQKILSRQHELTELMKLDMESLYVFGNLLLDQWSYMTAYLLGIANPELFHFQQLYEQMSSNKDKGLLSPFWDKHRKDVYWLYYQLRSYRNIFIEHVRRPWQRGNTMSVYGDDFNLFIPTPPGWLDDKQISERIKNIFHLAPKVLRDAPDDYWEKKNLKRVLEVTFTHIDDVESREDREKVWDVWKDVGGSTPSYDLIAYRLINFANSSIETIIDIIAKNPGEINLGRSNKVGS